MVSHETARDFLVAKHMGHERYASREAKSTVELLHLGLYSASFCVFVALRLCFCCTSAPEVFVSQGVTSAYNVVMFNNVVTARVARENPRRLLASTAEPSPSHGRPSLTTEPNRLPPDFGTPADGPTAAHENDFRTSVRSACSLISPRLCDRDAPSHCPPVSPHSRLPGRSFHRLGAGRAGRHRGPVFRGESPGGHC